MIRFGRHVTMLRQRLRVALRQWQGDDAYSRYVERCAAAGAPPLDRGRYFAARLEERYRGATRCC